MSLTPLNLFSNSKVERDETFDYISSKNILIVPNKNTLPPNYKSIPHGQLIFNKEDGLLYYSSEGKWKNLNSAGGVSLSITTGEQNIQVGAIGDIAGPPSLLYFGTQLGPTGGPPSASLIPFLNVYNNSNFLEDITTSASGPGPSMGSPGWRVPVKGVYKISVSTTIGGTVDGVNNPANSGFLGVGSPLNVSIGISKNNFGYLNTNLTSVTNAWTLPPSGIDNIFVPLTGFVTLELTKNDLIYVGLIVQNKNLAISLINASMSIELLFTS